MSLLALRCGERTAIVNVERNRRYTFREYHALTNRIANVMRGPLNLKKGDVALALLENDNLTFYISQLSSSKNFEAGISFKRLTVFEIYGRDGISLSEHWKDGVRTLHGITTDKFPNLVIVGGNQQSAPAFNTGHLLDELARHLTYILKTIKERKISSFEPTTVAVDGYVRLIKSSPTGDALVQFYLDCTPGYYNAEGKAKRAEEIFFGGRYGDGAIAFYQMLDHWRKSGDLGGFSLKKKRGLESFWFTPPLRITQITGIAQAAPVGRQTVFRLPHRVLLSRIAPGHGITTDSSDSSSSWIGRPLIQF